MPSGLLVSTSCEKVPAFLANSITINQIILFSVLPQVVNQLKMFLLAFKDVLNKSYVHGFTTFLLTLQFNNI